MYVLGIDIGTNGTKALLIDSDGRVRKQAYQPYGLSYPDDSSVEQDAMDWWRAVVTTVREAAQDHEAEISALSLSTQGGSTVAVDERGNPLAPAISWMDMRAGEQTQSLLSMKKAACYYRDTGVVPDPCYSIAHICWLRDHRPDLFQRASRFVTTLDFINMKLTGRCVIDYSNALMTGMFHIEKGDWDDSCLAAIPLERSRLAEILPPGAPAGNLQPSAAREMNLPESVRVYNGAHDQYAAAVGCGAVCPGDFMLSGGTAWVLLGSFDRIVEDRTMTMTPGRHVVEGLYGAFYSISVGGASLNWLMDALGMERKELAQVNEIAARRIEKNRNLYFYPYLNGTPAIENNPNARGVFAGLSLSSDRYDMALSVMEGIAFETARAVRLFEETGCPVNALRMLGGASKSDLWAKILANVTGRKVIRSSMTESAGMGAAIIAGVGIGLFKTYQEGCAICRQDETGIEPEETVGRFYQDKFKRYLAHMDAAMAFSKA